MNWEKCPRWNRWRHSTKPANMRLREVRCQPQCRRQSGGIAASQTADESMPARAGSASWTNRLGNRRRGKPRIASTIVRWLPTRRRSACCLSHLRRWRAGSFFNVTDWVFKRQACSCYDGNISDICHTAVGQRAWRVWHSVSGIAANVPAFGGILPLFWRFSAIPIGNVKIPLFVPSRITQIALVWLLERHTWQWYQECLTNSQTMHEILFPLPTPHPPRHLTFMDPYFSFSKVGSYGIRWNNAK